MSHAQLFAWASAVLMLATPAAVFRGNLVTCTVPAGTDIAMSVAPGMTCTDDKQKWALSASIKNSNDLGGCVANLTAPWNAWADGGIAKTDLAAATAIARAEISLKGTLYGGCNLAAAGATYRPFAAGKLSLWESSGVSKVRGGKASFSGFLESDIGASNALTFSGIITKGFGAGATIQFRVSLDVEDPNNNAFTACNADAVCSDLDPNSPGFDDIFAGGAAPIRDVYLTTTGDTPPLQQSFLSIDLGDDPNNP